jgi:hypothetical protein
VPSHETRGHAVGVAALLAIVGALFGDVLFAGHGLVAGDPSGDLPTYFAHWRKFGFDELRRGNLALWNPWVLAGTPFDTVCRKYS